jgi:hypothetical protein
VSDLEERLLGLERRLDPARPTSGGSGVEIIGYGEVSAVLALAELPGRVLKRMSGFPDAAAAHAYGAMVERYVSEVRAAGVPVTDTALVRLEPERGRHVVYLVQPRLDPARLGNAILRREPLEGVLPLLERVLILVRRVLDQNRLRSDGRALAIDAQLSNWHWPDAGGDGAQPTLIDVGTPFTMRDGELEIGVEVFLYAYPAPLRWWLRRSRSVEGYIDAFLRFETTIVDLLGNFVKEGAAEKIPGAIAFVNQWIARQPEAEALGRIDEASVRAYYAKDAGTLELALRARRLARFLSTRVLRRRYDFILPGRIAR